MFWYRLGTVILVLTVASGFFYWEYEFFPKYVAKNLTRLTKATTPTTNYKSLLAAPAPQTPDIGKSKRAIAFKRAFEEPEGFRLAPPLLDNLVTSSRLDTIGSLKHRPSETLFPVPRSIQSAVNFWKAIYSEYDSKKVVLHDKRYLNVIYEVIDFSELDTTSLSEEQISAFRKDHVEDKLAKIDQALKGLDNSQGTSRRLSPLEAKLWQLWSFLNEDMDRFAKAREKLRSQTGLRDRFRTALQRSGAYLSYMEDIFLSYQLPLELTRLVFVESMFTNKALSKTGAAGLWQFMPATARRYMKLNEWVDERLDPFIATDSAARLLQANYDLLGSWPLAINAYNTGAGRMKQAIRRLGTDDIGIIINKFTGRGYGFASRNFYPEFIAALQVADNYRQLFGELLVYEPITYEMIKLPARARLDDIAEILELDLASLRDLNPAFLSSIFESDIYLPNGARIRVPLGDGAKVIAGIYNLALKESYNLSPGTDKDTDADADESGEM